MNELTKAALLVLCEELAELKKEVAELRKEVAGLKAWATDATRREIYQETDGQNYL